MNMAVEGFKYGMIRFFLGGVLIVLALGLLAGFAMFGLIVYDPEFNFRTAAKRGLAQYNTETGKKEWVVHVCPGKKER